MNSTVDTDWRQCLDWLVRCRVMPARHVATLDNATALDLANALRDGVLLCHLMAFLSRGASDPTVTNEFICRPEQSQFLCMKNIRLFLSHCRSYFRLSDADLFEPESVFEVRSFGRVLHTLSVISKLSDSGVTGFPDENRKVEQEHEYYNTLEVLANDGEDGYDDFGTGSTPQEQAEEKIYESVVRRGLSSDSSISSAERVSVTRQRQSQGPTTKREFCIQEIYDTEKNYLESLKVLIERFQKPLQQHLSPQEIKEIFMFIEKLHRVHRSIYTDLNLAMQKQSRLRLHEVFLKHKRELLVYGEYCGHMSRAQALVEEICKNESEKRQQIEQCQIAANKNRFKLTDLLRVPMQRVLKYPLLLQNLLKLTDQNDPDRPGLNQALAEILDLATCINEVKRDLEDMSKIDKIQASIVDLQMPTNTKLNDYGRLQMDGELRVMKPSDAKPRQRHVFLFDRIILLCKNKGDSYTYKEAQEVKKTMCEELHPDSNLPTVGNSASQLIGRKSEKWSSNGFQVILTNNRAIVYLMYAKTDAMRKRWLTAFNIACENNTPPGYNANGHLFEMHTFKEPTECTVCKRLLRGSRLQGYFCKNSQMAVHKECIKSAEPVSINPPPPPRRAIPSSGAVSPGPNNINSNSPTTVQPPLPPRTSAHYRQSSGSSVSSIGCFNAVSIGEFHGPVISGRTPLYLSPHDTIQVLDSSDSDWWRGRNQVGQEGWFPSRLVRDNAPSRSTPVLSREGSYLAQDTVSPPPSGDRASISSTSSNHSLSRMASLNINADEEADLVNFSWYVGTMSRQDASNVLRGRETGTFLVRKSINRDRMGEYSISLTDNATVRHLRINKSNDHTNRYYLSDARSFESIESMIDYYTEHSLAECFSMLSTILSIPYGVICNSSANRPRPASPSSSNSSASIRPTRRQLKIISHAVAIYDYMATQPSQLSLLRGDRVAIIDKTGGDLGWWKGRNGDRIGFFPVQYVQEERVIETDGDL